MSLTNFYLFVTISKKIFVENLGDCMEENRSHEKSWIPKDRSWRWRLLTCIAMFVLASVGVVLTVLKQEMSWNYWRLLSCLFALISLALSFYLKKSKETRSLVTIWHEIFHWIGLVFSVGLLSNMVRIGILSPFAASIQALVLLSLATFLAGVYIEKTFLFIGVLMGLFALLLSYISVYSYLLFIPISIAFLVGLYWFVRTKSRQVAMERKE